jgi:predicted transport protein
MSEIRLFRLQSNTATEIPGSADSLEKSLQVCFEQNLETLLGVRFLASEYSTGQIHAGRIDSLGIDENGSPVILEYKRAVSENVVNQGLYYLDWLMDHKADFKLLVLERLGQEAADGIDWSGPRLICIASDFTKFDEHAIRQMNRNIDLVRYKRFGDGLLALELANMVSAARARIGPSVRTDPSAIRTLRAGVVEAPDLTVSVIPELLPLLEDIRDFFQNLGDDVAERAKGHYFTYRRLRNFCYMDVRQTKLNLKLKVDPSTVRLREGFTRDMGDGGAWNGETLEVLINSPETLEEAKPFILRAYEGV